MLFRFIISHKKSIYLRRSYTPVEVDSDVKNRKSSYNITILETTASDYRQVLKYHWFDISHFIPFMDRPVILNDLGVHESLKFKYNDPILIKDLCTNVSENLKDNPLLMLYKSPELFVPGLISRGIISTVSLHYILNDLAFTLSFILPGMIIYYLFKYFIYYDYIELSKIYKYILEYKIRKFKR